MPRLTYEPKPSLVTFGNPMPMIPETVHGVAAAWAYDLTATKQDVLMVLAVMAVLLTDGHWYRVDSNPAQGRDLYVNRAQVVSIAPARVAVGLDAMPPL